MVSARTSEKGYVLIALLFMVAVIMIVMAAAAPSIATQIKREREDELMRRGKQYQRAIQLYYRKFGRFPASIDQLQNTNNIRFLRHKYNDPITGKDEWRLIRFGQAKPKSPPAYLAGGQRGGQGSGANQGVLPGASAASISRPLSGSPTMGGGPIVGVASTSEKESLKEMDGKNHYNDWEFVYDPSLDPNRRQQPGTTGLDRPQRPSRDGASPNLPPQSPPRPH
jgi:type II secretory pathway pseudopilin PulG